MTALGKPQIELQDGYTGHGSARNSKGRKIKRKPLVNSNISSAVNSVTNIQTDVNSNERPQ
jgi:hypothetical protein